VACESVSVVRIEYFNLDDATAGHLDKSKRFGERKSEMGDEDLTCHPTSARVRAQSWLRTKVNRWLSGL
jgi:hypothetical protein